MHHYLIIIENDDNNVPTSFSSPLIFHRCSCTFSPVHNFYILYQRGKTWTFIHNYICHHQRALCALEKVVQHNRATATCEYLINHLATKALGFPTIHLLGYSSFSLSRDKAIKKCDIFLIMKHQFVIIAQNPVFLLQQEY